VLQVELTIMSDQLTLAVTQHQRDLLLEGLRYLRSSRRYEFRETSAPPDARRDGDLQEISGLMGRLEESAAGVPVRQ
jgi:hypothetical protein